MKKYYEKGINHFLGTTFSLDSLVSRFGYNPLHQLSTNQKQIMGITKKVLLVIAFLLIILGVTYIYKRYQNNGVASVPDNYSQDPDALAEMEGRILKFEGKKSPNLIFNFEGGETFTAGYFPLTSIKDNKKFTKEKRSENRGRIQDLITAYDKFVSQASEIHKVPRILIYGLMAVEHDDSVSVAKSALQVDSSGVYIGLMQMAVVTANDTLARGVTNKQLSVKQVDWFKKKIGKNIDAITRKDLQDAETNIHASCAFLSVLIRKFGLDDLHKIIFSYNRGEFRLSKDKNTGLSINELINKYKNTSNSDGANYVIKTLGVNGSFDILQELGVND